MTMPMNEPKGMTNGSMNMIMLQNVSFNIILIQNLTEINTMITSMSTTNATKNMANALNASKSSAKTKLIQTTNPITTIFFRALTTVIR